MPVRACFTVLLCLAAVASCGAKEAVYFKTGFSLEVDSHTQEDQMLVFHVGGGTLQFPADEVLRIDVLPDAIPAKAQSSSALVPPKPSQDILNEAALLQGLEPELIRSVAKIESAFRQDAVSPKGALGLMQLMPGTAAQLGVNPLAPDENAQGGAKYLRDLLIKYNGNSALALAAYNAGPGAVTKFGGVPPYSETRQYVLKVIREYERQKRAKETAAAAGPFQTNKRSEAVSQPSTPNATN